MVVVVVFAVVDCDDDAGDAGDDDCGRDATADVCYCGCSGCCVVGVWGGGIEGAWLLCVCSWLWLL